MTDFVKSARLMVLDCEYKHEMQLEAKRARSWETVDEWGVEHRYDPLTVSRRSDTQLIDRDKHSAVKDVYQGKCELRRQDFTPVTISKDYNGRHIMDLLNDKPGWSYKEAKLVIENEGGHIDDQHIIRR